MDRKSLGSYVDELRGGNASAFAAVGRAAVLIVRDLGKVEVAVTSAFVTKFVPRLEPQGAPGGSAPPPSEPRVTVGQVWVLKKRESGAFQDRIGIGRARNVDVLIPLAEVSKYHAYFERDNTGNWSVTDAGSRNGTQANGKVLVPRIPYPIKDGSEICFGPCRFEFRTAEGFVELVNRRAGQR